MTDLDPSYGELLDAAIAESGARGRTPELRGLWDQLYARYLELFDAQLLGGTTPGGLPYPEPTDPIAAGADAIKALANAVDAKFGSLVSDRIIAGTAQALVVNSGLFRFVYGGSTVWQIGADGTLTTGIVPFARVTGNIPFSRITGDIPFSRITGDIPFSRVTGTVPINQGGTGATSASAARSNLGLGNTATDNVIPVARGGTGATTTTSARENLGLGAAALEDVVRVARGGTGATTASGALAALGGVPESDVVVSTSGATIANKIPRYDSSGRLACGSPAAANQTVPKSYADTKLALSGGTVTGNLYLPNATAASSNYVVGYLNGDGRISRGASSRRFKRDITPLTAEQLTIVQDALQRLELVQFYYRDEVIEQSRPTRTVQRVVRAAVLDDAGVELEPAEIVDELEPDPDWIPPAPELQIGLIAEDLVDAGLGWLVHLDEDGRPYGIHYERLALALLPVMQDHERRLTALEQRSTQ